VYQLTLSFQLISYHAILLQLTYEKLPTKIAVGVPFVGKKLHTSTKPPQPWEPSKQRNSLLKLKEKKLLWVPGSWGLVTQSFRPSG
jgi:hypothetical protein